MRAQRAVVAVVMLVGCGPSPRRLPDRVNIAIIDATVAPAMEGGKSWDGVGQVPVEVLQGVAGALAAAPTRGRAEVATKVGAVAVQLTALAASGLAAPDAKGVADLSAGGTSRRLVLPEVRDTFTPTWVGLSFDQVPLVEDVRLRVQLVDDDDIGSDDPIGTAELNYEDLIAALQGERVTQIRVAEQTRGQLLYVGISVTAR